MDQAIVDYLRRHYSLRIGTAAAERLRIEIGSAYPLEDELVGRSARRRHHQRPAAQGHDHQRGSPRSPRHAAGANRRRHQGHARRSAAPTWPPTWSTTAWCWPAAVRCCADSIAFSTEQTGLPTRVCADPLTAVARGTYICLEHFDRWRGAMQSSDDDV